MKAHDRPRSQNPVDFLKEYFRGKKVSDEFGIHISANPVRFSEQAHFTLHMVQEPDGERSLDPIFVGLFSAGRASQNIRGWVDGDYFETALFRGEKRVSLTEGLLDIELFKILGELVPPGGSFMVSYSLFSKESRIHRETKRGLDRGYPPAVTPLGFLLFLAGCGMGFKDWYFAEGGREGPEKLQGFKAIDPQAAKQKTRELLQELRIFSAVPEEDDLGQTCKLRAEQVVQELEKLSKVT